MRSLSRSIASLQVHVEQAIRRIKTFRILSWVFPLRMKKSLQRVWKFCCYLSIFLPPLVAVHKGKKALFTQSPNLLSVAVDRNQPSLRIIFTSSSNSQSSTHKLVGMSLSSDVKAQLASCDSVTSLHGQGPGTLNK